MKANGLIFMVMSHMLLSFAFKRIMIVFAHSLFFILVFSYILGIYLFISFPKVCYKTIIIVLL